MLSMFRNSLKLRIALFLSNIVVSLTLGNWFLGVIKALPHGAKKEQMNSFPFTKKQTARDVQSFKVRQC